MDDGVNRAGLPSGKKDNISKAGLCGFGRRSHSRLSRFIGFKFNIYLKKARPPPGRTALQGDLSNGQPCPMSIQRLMHPAH
ncbi:hypothetical protein [Burkholderia stagnalis]|uniref:Uncharacterized protein n=1 Tax=Burkholderia stagnalis TaxID=1503054 RepID=A0A6L3MVP9_9BURK|nr:hypothetical protein [Burkholderia stagnalis]KAB0637181.1 hypothetical protein F7R25_16885 [Burkholderia stagnalis]